MNAPVAFFLVTAIITPTLSSGQPVKTAPVSAKSKPATPVLMKECELGDKCATWTFLGPQGNGQGPAGEVENLSIVHFDSVSIVIRRADSTGPTAGLTADYTGTLKDDRIEGTFTSSWPGHWDSMKSNWRASVGAAAAVELPPEIHECDLNCNTLKLQNDNYLLMTRYPWDKSSGPIFWKVESWSRQSVRLHRTVPADQVFAGQMSPDGNSLINITVNGTPDPKVKIVWGAAIGSVYGSNRERDAVVGQPYVTQQGNVAASALIMGLVGGFILGSAP